MTDTHETIADIIAEARDKYTVHQCNECAWRKCCSKGFGSEECGKFRESIFLKLGIEDGYFTQLLDRIEAAHKRERENYDAKIADLQLRVKLWTDRSDELVKKCVEQYAKLKQVGDCAKLREALKAIGGLCAGLMPTWDGAVGRIKDMVETALAAPPRNCDKYATADEALKAQEQMFNDSNFANGECKLGCPECDNPRVGCKIAWLFAPATEKEGGAK